MPESKVPEWVFVWWWARRSRAPRVLLPFPQMHGEAIDEAAMLSDEEYAALRAEWIEAGSPRVSLSEIVERSLASSMTDRVVEILKETAE